MSSSSALRWGEQSPEGVDEAQARVLDAAHRCLTANGYQRVSMEAIAAEAKISRATLYRYFANRDEVLKGVILRESRRHLLRIVPEAKAEPDVGSSILALVRLTLDAGQQTPAMSALANRENYGFTRQVLIDSAAELFEILAELLATLVDGREQELRAGVTVPEASEWILRTILSLLTVRGPENRSRAELDEYLARFLLPVIVADAEGPRNDQVD